MRCLGKAFGDNYIIEDTETGKTEIFKAKYVNFLIKSGRIEGMTGEQSVEDLNLSTLNFKRKKCSIHSDLYISLKELNILFIADNCKTTLYGYAKVINRTGSLLLRKLVESGIIKIRGITLQELDTLEFTPFCESRTVYLQVDIERLNQLRQIVSGCISFEEEMKFTAQTHKGNFVRILNTSQLEETDFSDVFENGWSEILYKGYTLRNLFLSLADIGILD